MTLASDVLRHLQWLVEKIVGPVVLSALLLLTSCSNAPKAGVGLDESAPPSLFAPSPVLNQVDPPDLIQALAPWLDTYAPQVRIRQPRAGQVFDVATVSVVLQVQDLPIYKDAMWGMGPHVQILLDNQPYGSVYDLTQPIVLKDLTPGTHTIRAFAVRPWDESFKNEGSYAQVTFHIFAQTDENSPKDSQPLLTYGAPLGVYGAEPVLLDFYLLNAPLHQVAEDNPAISDWRVRYTVNGESLIIKDWESIYVEGLKPGQNWVQLTLVDDAGEPVEGVFNNTVQLINYDPGLDDSLAKIVRGDVTLAETGGIVDPDYEPEMPEPEMPEPEMPELPNEDSKPERQPSQIAPEEVQPEEVEPPEEMPQIDVPKSEVTAPKPVDETSELLDDDEDDSSESDAEFEKSAVNSDLPMEPPSVLEPSLSEKAKIDQLETPAVLEEAVTPVDAQAVQVPEDKDVEAVPEPGLTLKVDASVAPEFADSEVMSEPIEDAPVMAEPTIDTPVETFVEPTTDKPTEEEVAPSKRRYLQRLYDYRDRSMETYGR
ncbi:MAG: hypothetical protein AAF243_15435 [Cyanobacteria bacterium P01_A01_bin.137]